MKNITSKITILAFSAAIFSPALVDTAQAQQDPNRQERRETRRQQMQNMTPEQRAAFRAQRQAQRGQNGGGNWGGRGGNRGAGAGMGGGAMMNPEGQEAILGAAGITDKATMDAIMAFAAERQKARQPLVQQAQALSSALLSQNGSEEALSSQLTQFRIGVEVYKREHTDALKALDTKIEYSKRPQLEALLTVMGLLGDEVPLIGGPMVAMGPSARQIMRANRPQDGDATAGNTASGNVTTGAATTSTSVTTTTATPAGTTTTSTTAAKTTTPKTTTPKAATPKTTQ